MKLWEKNKQTKKTPLCTKWCLFFLHVDISVAKLFPLQDHVPRCSYIMAFTEFFFFFYNQSLRIKEKWGRCD